MAALAALAPGVWVLVDGDRVGEVLRVDHSDGEALVRLAPAANSKDFKPRAYRTSDTNPGMDGVAWKKFVSLSTDLGEVGQRLLDADVARDAKDWSNEAAAQAEQKLKQTDAAQLAAENDRIEAHLRESAALFFPETRLAMLAAAAEKHFREEPATPLSVDEGPLRRCVAARSVAAAASVGKYPTLGSPQLHAGGQKVLVPIRVAADQRRGNGALVAMWPAFFEDHKGACKQLLALGNSQPHHALIDSMGCPLPSMSASLGMALAELASDAGVVAAAKCLQGLRRLDAPEEFELEVVVAFLLRVSSVGKMLSNQAAPCGGIQPPHTDRCDFVLNICLEAESAPALIFGYCPASFKHVFAANEAIMFLGSLPHASDPDDMPRNCSGTRLNLVVWLNRSTSIAVPKPTTGAICKHAVMLSGRLWSRIAVFLDHQSLAHFEVAGRLSGPTCCKDAWDSLASIGHTISTPQGTGKRRCESAWKAVDSKRHMASLMETLLEKRLYKDQSLLFEGTCEFGPAYRGGDTGSQSTWMPDISERSSGSHPSTSVSELREREKRCAIA